MKYKKAIIPCILIITITILALYWYRNELDSTVIKYFPINENIYFLELGSNLEIFKQADNTYKVVGESWSRTNKKVYLRQDVNMLFQNGFLKQFDYPWKKETDWIINKLETPLEKDSIYSLLSYHHAEIHDNDYITSSQAVTEDKLYVFEKGGIWNAFKVPKNDIEKKEQEILDSNYKQVRELLLEQGLKELNINESSYWIFDLDTFSLRGYELGLIKKEKWESVLGGLWEGLYSNYIFSFIKDELKYFSPPMPWVLVDKLGSHILVIYQQADGKFGKLIMSIK